MVNIELVSICKGILTPWSENSVFGILVRNRGIIKKEKKKEKWSMVLQGTEDARGTRLSLRDGNFFDVTDNRAMGQRRKQWRIRREEKIKDNKRGRGRKRERERERERSFFGVGQARKGFLVRS